MVSEREGAYHAHKLALTYLTLCNSRAYTYYYPFVFYRVLSGGAGEIDRIFENIVVHFESLFYRLVGSLTWQWVCRAEPHFTTLECVEDRLVLCS